MAYTEHPHPEERSRERVSKDAGCQLRDGFPLIAKRDACMPPLSQGRRGKKSTRTSASLHLADARLLHRRPHALRRRRHVEMGDAERRQRVEDGKVRIPDGPGWGIEVNRDWLAKAAYRKSDAG